MKFDYVKAALKIFRAGFSYNPTQMLNDKGHGCGIIIKNVHTGAVHRISDDGAGMFLKAIIEGFITSREYTMPTYRAKWSPGLNDDDAFPAFNAEDAQNALRIANYKWPAKPGEDAITLDVLQEFTNSGWKWLVQPERCTVDGDGSGGCDSEWPCYNNTRECIRNPK